MGTAQLSPPVRSVLKHIKITQFVVDMMVVVGRGGGLWINDVDNDTVILVSEKWEMVGGTRRIHWSDKISEFQDLLVALFVQSESMFTTTRSFLTLTPDMNSRGSRLPKNARKYQNYKDLQKLHGTRLGS